MSSCAKIPDGSVTCTVIVRLGSRAVLRANAVKLRCNAGVEAKDHPHSKRDASRVQASVDKDKTDQNQSEYSSLPDRLLQTLLRQAADSHACGPAVWRLPL
jgi:hypothetical protein